MSRSAFRTRRLALALSILVAAPASMALAQVSKEEAACRAAISKGVAKYMKGFGKAVIGCHKDRDTDASMASTDCNDIQQADPDGKVGNIAASAKSGISSKCAEAPTVLGEFGRCPTPAETSDDLGATNGIDDYDELADCLIDHATIVAAQAASDIMGAPTPPLSDALAGCHGALGAGFTKVIDTTMKVRAKCQKDSDKAGGPLDFTCLGADPDGKILKAETTAKAKITEACSDVGALQRGQQRSARGLEELDSCGETAEDLATCTVDEEAEVASDGAAAMAYELPGVCPGAGSYVVASTQSATEVDIGWKGYAHDMDPVLGYRAVNFAVTCDADCNNCVSGAPTTVAEACRCSEDASELCTDNSDCSGSCKCYFGPPTAYTSGGTPACVLTEVAGTITGSIDPDGGTLALDVPVRGRVHTGIGINQPCPICTDGLCDGGQRNGLACSVDAVDATFGAVSHDCPPNSGSNITGLGMKTTLSYTTGSLSLPAGTKCDPPYATDDCICAVCSSDSSTVCNANSDCAGTETCSLAPSIECSANADCTGVNAGPCHPTLFRCQQAFSLMCGNNGDCASVNVGNCDPSTCTGNGGTNRKPNNCSTDVCTDVGGGEGRCLGDEDSYCDGLVRSNGDGIIACSNDFDCDAFVTPGEPFVCPNNDCGTCSAYKPRECFLNPVVATGTPGSSAVGVGCLGNSGNPSMNAALGLPGAYRVKQNIGFESGLCSDGLTPFIPPGGSNCP